jgi:hypothetical protein
MRQKSRSVSVSPSSSILRQARNEDGGFPLPARESTLARKIRRKALKTWNSRSGGLSPESIAAVGAVGPDSLSPVPASALLRRLGDRRQGGRACLELQSRKTCIKPARREQRSVGAFFHDATGLEDQDATGVDDRR